MDDCLREVDKSEEELKKKVYACYANEIAWWNYANRVLTLIWVSHFAMVFVFWDDEYVAMKSLIIAFIAMIICFSGLSRKVGELRYISRLIKNGEFFLLDCKICDVKKEAVNDTYRVFSSWSKIGIFLNYFLFFLFLSFIIDYFCVLCYYFCI